MNCSTAGCIMCMNTIQQEHSSSQYSFTIYCEVSSFTKQEKSENALSQSFVDIVSRCLQVQRYNFSLKHKQYSNKKTFRTTTNMQPVWLQHQPSSALMSQPYRLPDAIITTFVWRCHTLYLAVPFRHSCHHKLRNVKLPNKFTHPAP